MNGNPAKRTGGAALVALESGWVTQGERMDNCYSASKKAWGITTVVAPGKKKSLTLSEIAANVTKLYDEARRCLANEFLVAYSDGRKRSLNGYTPTEIASAFAQQNIPPNIVFDSSFAKLVDKFDQ